MKQLIVNADDFGLTKGVSEGILAAHRNGLVTSTTVMANGAAFSEAVAMSRRSPDLGIGVHLNLSEGRPVSPPSTIPSLVDARERLHWKPGRLWKALVNRQVRLDEIETELRAQIGKVVRAGIAPTHLDGHKHVHVLPGVSDRVIRLAREFSIRSVRCPVEDAPSLAHLLADRQGSRVAILKQYLVARGVSQLAWSFRQKLDRAGLTSPAHFYGLSQTGFLDTKAVQEVLRRLPDEVSELMCHPGYLDPELEATGTRLRSQREVEIRALTVAEVRKLAMDQGIQLVSYREAAAPARENEAAA
jgi:hopanoid biosynthesis associated protein HpnK